jgi:hypothetical protein
MDSPVNPTSGPPTAVAQWFPPVHPSPLPKGFPRQPNLRSTHRSSEIQGCGQWTSNEGRSSHLQILFAGQAGRPLYHDHVSSHRVARSAKDLVSSTDGHHLLQDRCHPPHLMSLPPSLELSTFSRRPSRGIEERVGGGKDYGDGTRVLPPSVA